MLSLIQTSQNRRKELIRFVKSLNAQTDIDFKQIQLIFVDQGNNRDIFDILNHQINFVYIKGKICSLSKARNVGLEYVKGEYIGFPDDDCWYEPDTLSLVLSRLELYDGVSAKGCDEKWNLTNKFPHSGTFLFSRYHHYGAISYTIFVRFYHDICFDENIGVGSPYGLQSGEETDYIIQVLGKAKKKLIYDSSIIVHHPLNGLGNFKDNQLKAYYYARGHGYVMRKNNYPFFYILLSLIRPLVGICMYFTLGDFSHMKQSGLLLKGRIEGFFIYSKLRKLYWRK